MTPEEYRQHYVDALVIELTDAAEVATLVLVTDLIAHTEQRPTLDETLEIADWAWEVFVNTPMRTLLEDVKAEPTDLEDVRVHFRMLARRKHVESVAISARLEEQEHEHEHEHEHSEDDRKHGGYL